MGFHDSFGGCSFRALAIQDYEQDLALPGSTNELSHELLSIRFTEGALRGDIGISS